MNIQEKNKLIAEFMELPLVPCNIGTEDGVVTEGYQHPKVNRPCTIDGLQYKYSWDWLMPVVEKIEDIECKETSTDLVGYQLYDIEIRQNVTTIHGTNIEETAGDKLFNTYNAVIEFINEYNKNK